MQVELHFVLLALFGGRLKRGGSRASGPLKGKFAREVVNQLRTVFPNEPDVDFLKIV